MKKIVAAILVIGIMVLGFMSWMAAQAEWVDIRAWRIGTENGKVVYYVTYASEDETFMEFEVSQSVFETAVSTLHERRMEEERQERIKEYQSDRGSWVKDVAAWCSFWNPND